MHNILLVEDDDVTRLVMRKHLEGAGYTVFMTSSGAETLRLLSMKRMDAILLDRMLPDADGLDLIKDIRKRSEAPIMILSSKDSLIDRVVGLEIGADDYLVKSIEKSELLAIVKARIRQVGMEKDRRLTDRKPAQNYQFGKWKMKNEKGQAYDELDRSADLTSMEFRLLEALAERSGCVTSRDQLLDALHTGGMAASDRSIDIGVARIRKKLRENSKHPVYLKTVRGMGYILECEKV